MELSEYKGHDASEVKSKVLKQREVIGAAMIEKDLARQVLPFDEPEILNYICQFSEIRHYGKGEGIYGIGEVQTKIYMLLEGVVQFYFLDETQERITDSFFSGSVDNREYL